MELKLLVLADAAASPALVAKYRDLCRMAAFATGEPVGLSLQGLDQIQQVQENTGAPEIIDNATNVGYVPTGPTPVIYRQDGKVDWAVMWSTYAELALYGGPPNRGDDSPITASSGAPGAQPAPDLLWDMQQPVVMSSARRRARQAPVDVVWEMRRGIAETTGLYGKPYPQAPERPSWLAIMCSTKKQAAWMCAAIILENVEAMCEDTLLFVPCSPDFELLNEVRSVINVVAKVNHYWEQFMIRSGGYDPALNWEHDH